jgi:hypothetical protein
LVSVKESGKLLDRRLPVKEKIVIESVLSRKGLLREMIVAVNNPFF